MPGTDLHQSFGSVQHAGSGRGQPGPTGYGGSLSQALAVLADLAESRQAHKFIKPS